MEVKSRQSSPEIWGGIECTINRIGDAWSDQLDLAGFYKRPGDIKLLSGLGFSKFRFPILWEKHQAEEHEIPDFSWASVQLAELREKNIEPIAGLLHHGSGPAFTSLDDPEFPFKFAGYARKVAQAFPWIQFYTPVNEPLTTARFSGLYGHWYPHSQNEGDFFRMLINQLKGTVLAMQEIRKINPAAKLVQTEDVGFTHSTPHLSYQAAYEMKGVG